MNVPDEVLELVETNDRPEAVLEKTRHQSMDR